MITTPASTATPRGPVFPRGRRVTRLVMGGASPGVLAALACVPLVSRNQYLLDVLAQAGLFVLLAWGLNIVVSLAGLLDLGYIAFWAIGGYSAALLAGSASGIHLPFVLVIPAAILASAVFATLIGIPTLRLRGDYLAIVTLGFGEIVRLSLVNASDFTGGPSGVQGIDRPNVLGAQFGADLQSYYYLILAVCVVGYFVGNALKHGRLGVTWQALRDDELAARACGIHPLRAYLVAFGIGAAYASVSGVLYAMKQTAIAPDSYTVDTSFLVLAMVVLGGYSGGLKSVAAAAVLIVVLPEVLREFADFRLIIFGPALVLIVVVRAHWTTLTARVTNATSALADIASGPSRRRLRRDR